MLEVTYVLAIVFGCHYAFKRLATDPDREKYWGPSVTQTQFTKMEKEVENLKSQLESYKAYRVSYKSDASREESMV